MTFFFDVSRQKPLFKVVFQDGFPTRILVESRPGPREKNKTKKMADALIKPGDLGSSQHFEASIAQLIIKNLFFFYLFY